VLFILDQHIYTYTYLRSFSYFVYFWDLRPFCTWIMSGVDVPWVKGLSGLIAHSSKSLRMIYVPSDLVRVRREDYVYVRHTPEESDDSGRTAGTRTSERLQQGVTGDPGRVQSRDTSHAAGLTDTAGGGESGSLATSKAAGSNRTPPTPPQHRRDKRPVCWRCGKPGHFRRYCRQRPPETTPRRSSWLARTKGKGGVIPLVIFLPRGYVTHITELY
jgi:hypothetical protein